MRLGRFHSYTRSRCNLSVSSVARGIGYRYGRVSISNLCLRERNGAPNCSCCAGLLISVVAVVAGLLISVVACRLGCWRLITSIRVRVLPFGKNQFLL